MQKTLLRVSGGLNPCSPSPGGQFRDRAPGEFLVWVNQTVRHIIVDLERRGVAKKRDEGPEVPGSKVLYHAGPGKYARARRRACRATYEAGSRLGSTSAAQAGRTRNAVLRATARRSLPAAENWRSQAEQWRSQLTVSSRKQSGKPPISNYYVDFPQPGPENFITSSPGTSPRTARPTGRLTYPVRFRVGACLSPTSPHPSSTLDSQVPRKDPVWMRVGRFRRISATSAERQRFDLSSGLHPPKGSS
jgi:hypothetical protein